MDHYYAYTPNLIASHTSYNVLSSHFSNVKDLPVSYEECITNCCVSCGLSSCIEQTRSGIFFEKPQGFIGVVRYGE